MNVQEWLDQADALARKHGPAYEALSREYHPKAVAALRAVLDLADEAEAKGRSLRQVPELLLAGTAYVGMAERIRDRVADTLGVEP